MSTLKNRSGLIAIALLIIATGALMIFFQTNLIPATFKPLIFSWQMLLISIGIVTIIWTQIQAHHLFSSGGILVFPHPSSSGMILIIVGAVFLLPKIPIQGFEVFQNNGRALCWALLLILLGLTFLFQIIFGKQHKGACCKHHRDRIHTCTTEEGYIERNYVFSGGEEVVETSAFRGGDINCVFGGLELDLTHSQLAEGVHILEINTVFGGIELFIPSNWKVEIKPSCVFGSFEDKRRPASFDMEENKKLIIVVSAVFGGGEVRTK